MKNFSLKVRDGYRLNPTARAIGGERRMRFGKWKSLQSAITAILLASVVPAYSATLIDTGTPQGGNYADFGGWSYFAGGFSLASSTNITSVFGYFSNQYGSDGSFSVQILADGGNIPGSAVLFSQDVNIGNHAAANWYGVSGVNWTLGAGNYWVAFVPVSSSLDGQAPYPAPNPLVEYALNTGGWNGDNSGFGVRMEGDAVVAQTPLPAALPLFATGLAGLGLIAHRRKRKQAA